MRHIERGPNSNIYCKTYFSVTPNDLDLWPWRLYIMICMDNWVVVVDVQGYHIWTQIDSIIPMLLLPSWSKKSSHGSTDGATCWNIRKGLPKEGYSFQSSIAHSNNLNTYWFLWTLGNFPLRPGRRKKGASKFGKSSKVHHRLLKMTPLVHVKTLTYLYVFQHALLQLILLWIICALSMTARFTLQTYTRTDFFFSILSGRRRILRPPTGLNYCVLYPRWWP